MTIANVMSESLKVVGVLAPVIITGTALWLGISLLFFILGLFRVKTEKKGDR